MAGQASPDCLLALLSSVGLTVQGWWVGQKLSFGHRTYLPPPALARWASRAVFCFPGCIRGAGTTTWVRPAEACEARRDPRLPADARRCPEHIFNKTPARPSSPFRNQWQRERFSRALSLKAELALARLVSLAADVGRLY